MKRLLTLSGVVIALVLSGCGGDDKGETSRTTTSPPAAEEVETPTEITTPAAGAGQLPPEFLECMADEGFEVESIADVHSAPPLVLQACFGTIHEAGDVP